MTAITIQDLDNAKLDVDHIAEIANSTNTTAVDRLGHEKLTVKGAIDRLTAINFRGAWATATAYAVKDAFSEGGFIYVAVVAHTSTSIAADLAAGKIGLYQGVTVQDIDEFQAPGDFTPGTSTQLTLSRAPGAKNNAAVYFGGAYQGPNQWNLADDVITFNDPIPLGVEEIFVQIGILQAALTPTDGSVTDDAVASGSGLYVRLNEFPFITDGNTVTGNGSTDDAAAILARFTAEAGRQIIFPARTYYLGSDVNAPDGSNAYFQKGVTFAGPGVIKNVTIEYEQGNATSVAASKMQIDRLWEQSDVRKAADVAYLWPAKTRTFAAFSKTFGASDGGAGSPCFGTMSYAVNNGSPGEVCGSLSIGSLIVNGSIFGQNIIATADTGLNAKIFGMEIDYEPSIGTNVDPTGVGFNLVGFNETLARAMVIGTIGGGEWSAGINFLNGMSITANCLSAEGTLSANTFIDASAGTYANGTFIVGNGFTRRMQYKDAGGSEAGAIWSDSGGNINVSLNSAALIVSGSNTTEGSPLAVVRDSGGVAALQAFVARGSAANAANAALKVNGQSVTGRSINAGGTINAGGADYAEYEIKRDDCGPIAKGQIIGFDADGKLTDRFSLAVSFGIKSTNPSLVGGDVWGIDIGEQPEAPQQPEAPGACPTKPQTALYEKYAAQIEQEHAAAVQQWEIRVAAYDDALRAYNSENAQYLELHAAWSAKVEAARARVDRVAYCGKVPVNVFGASPGQYVVPNRRDDDSIVGVLLDEATISFAQYRIAVGRVRRILSDGRAEVSIIL